jgi:hypothetical protein
VDIKGCSFEVKDVAERCVKQFAAAAGTRNSRGIAGRAAWSPPLRIV